MKVSIRLGSSLSASEILRLAAVAESAGVDRCWLADNPYERSALVSATAIAREVPRLPIGIATLSVAARHPVVLAQDVATMAGYCRTPPAIALGLGPSDHRRALGFRGSGLRRLEESIEVARVLLAGGSIGGEGAGEGGAGWPAQPLAKSPTAIRLRVEPVELPLLVGALGPKVLGLSGRLADGAVLSMGAGLPYIEWAVERLREAGADRPGFQVVAYAMFAPGSDSEVRDGLRAALTGFAMEMTRNPGWERLFWGLPVPDDLADRIAARARAGRSADDLISDDLLDSVAVRGSQADWRERFEAYERLGVTEVALGLGSWTPDPEEAIRSVPT